MADGGFPLGDRLPAGTLAFASGTFLTVHAGDVFCVFSLSYVHLHRDCLAQCGPTVSYVWIHQRRQWSGRRSWRSSSPAYPTDRWRGRPREPASSSSPPLPFHPPSSPSLAIGCGRTVTEGRAGGAVRCGRLRDDGGGVGRAGHYSGGIGKGNVCGHAVTKGNRKKRRRDRRRE